MSQREPPKRRPQSDDDDTEENAVDLDKSADPLNVESGPRWTANLYILVHEAGQMASGEVIDNPALPINERVAEKALDAIERREIDHEPFWTDVEEYPDLAGTRWLNE